MNPEEKKEFYDKIAEADKFMAVQTQINDNLAKSVENLEKNLLKEINSNYTLVFQKLEQIHIQTKKTNGNVIRNREDIDSLRQISIETSKDVEYMKDVNKEQDEELGRLKDVVEPIKVAQRFPQMVRYTVIGFALVVILSMWSMLGVVKSIKKEIHKVENLEKPSDIEPNTTEQLPNNNN